MSERWITERARVLTADADGLSLWVAADKASACGSCKAKSGCGTSMLAKLGANQVAVRALLSPELASQTFREGQDVDLAVDRNAFVKVALVMYLIPLLCLLSGVLLAPLVSANAGDGVVATAALVGLFFGGWVANRILYRWRNDERLQPLVLRSSLSLDEAVVQLT